MKNSIKILIVLFLITQSVFSQNIEKVDSTYTGLKKGEKSIVPLPIIGANPTVGILYGVAVSANAMFGEHTNTRMSTSVGTVNYSTNKQLLTFFKTNIYTPQDEWILLGDWRFFDSSQPTFGLGTGPDSRLILSDSIEYKDGLFTKPLDPSQQMEFAYVKLSEIFLKRVKKYFYAGLGYHLDYHYNIKDNTLNLDTTSGKQLALTSHYTYSKIHNFDPEEYVLSGLSVNFVYDSRDNAANPYHGRYVLASYRMNPEFMGSTQNSTSLWLEYRDYFSVSKKRERNIIAFWAYADIQTTGVRPYMDLGAIGWDQFGKSGRAYTQGRFRGNNIIYNEFEYRFHLWGSKNNPELFGGVAFVNATTASNYDDNINLYQYMNLAYGVGLRVMLVKSARINVTIDYAWGDYGAHGIFINANEVF